MPSSYRCALALCLAPLLLHACDCGLTPNVECDSTGDCPAGYWCVGGLCTLKAADASITDASDADGSSGPDRVSVDAVAQDSAQVDGAVTDAESSDGALADSLALDVAHADALLAEASQPDAAQPDAARADTAQPDTAQPDTAMPDTAVPDAYEPCGNQVVDPGEECDGQPHCVDCQPEPGYQCQSADDGTTVCYLLFPVGAPAHMQTFAFNVANLVSYDITCTSAEIDTDLELDPVNFCSAMVPNFTVDPPGGPGLRVYLFRDLQLHGSLVFSGSRVPVIVVYGDAFIDADIDVGAKGQQPGPGGQHDCGASTGAMGNNTTDAGGGGGGGGSLESGGRGGSMHAGLGAAGGEPLPDIGVLRGGCRGGQGNKDSQMSGNLPPGGAGGGAIQISASGSLSISGRIYADGAGGSGGYRSNKSGGGGGGAGGSIWIEARSLDTASASFVLRGGGGGQGASYGGNGEGGHPGRAGGAGGSSVSSAGSPGGAGGSGGGSASNGVDGTNGSPTADHGGGGGGGSGGGLTQINL